MLRALHLQYLLHQSSSSPRRRTSSPLSYLPGQFPASSAHKPSRQTPRSLVFLAATAGCYGGLRLRAGPHRAMLSSANSARLYFQIAYLEPCKTLASRRHDPSARCLESHTPAWPSSKPRCRHCCDFHRLIHHHLGHSILLKAAVPRSQVNSIIGARLARSGPPTSITRRHDSRGRLGCTQERCRLGLGQPA